ncbi:hypothetical protein ILYODFUR_004424, partial [Ilyodon furcidens]
TIIGGALPPKFIFCIVANQSASDLHSSSANHPSRLHFKRPSYKESPALQLSFDPPPPHLHHHASSSFRLPYLFRPPLHHQ